MNHRTLQRILEQRERAALERARAERGAIDELAGDRGLDQVRRRAAADRRAETA